MNNCSTCPDAVAFIKGGSMASQLSGRVNFYQKADGVLVVANVCGLPENDTGFFAFHIHEGDSCKGENFSDTEGHYNPKDVGHPLHSGDLPPLLKHNRGAFLAVMTDRFCVNDIIGRTVVIHNGADDFKTQPAGNAGTKIACGIIKRC